MSGSVLKGRAASEGEGLTAIRIGCGVLTNRMPCNILTVTHSANAGILATILLGQHRIIRLRHLSEKLRSDFVTFS